jgi:hypothetical protein
LNIGRKAIFGHLSFYTSVAPLGLWCVVNPRFYAPVKITIALVFRSVDPPLGLLILAQREVGKSASW